jgi:hypothetical protein
VGAPLEVIDQRGPQYGRRPRANRGDVLRRVCWERLGAQASTTALDKVGMLTMLPEMTRAKTRMDRFRHF